MCEDGLEHIKRHLRTHANPNGTPRNKFATNNLGTLRVDPSKGSTLEEDSSGSAQES